MRLAFLPALIGAGALTAFTVFLFVGPFHIVELPLDTTEILIFDACLCLTFFLQHSLMIREGVRTRIEQRIPQRYFGALFTTVTAVMLFLLMLLWQESSQSIAAADGIFRWLLQGIFLAAVAAQPWIARSLGAVGGRLRRQGPGAVGGRGPSPTRSHTSRGALPLGASPFLLHGTGDDLVVPGSHGGQVVAERTLYGMDHPGHCSGRARSDRGPWGGIPNLPARGADVDPLPDSPLRVQ